MSRTVIQAEDLAKRYNLGVLGHHSLRKELQSAWARLWGTEDPNACVVRGERVVCGADDVLWALRDVSFAVHEGEVLGIIGRNGAGKSTLLKILSRVTTPTSGVVRLRGHVASLLEVGTGFHPELTGRENVFLNGAILGMRGREIERKFDEIVAFAEVEKFIDTPVKRYSSGMYVRLAFAVAAHLEPEILLVDEVLAVGDAAFQKKCLGKMDAVAGEGRTVLFVSHNMVALQSLCSRAIRLHGGSVAEDGPAATVVSHYLRNSSDGTLSAGLEAVDFDTAPGNDEVRLRSVRIEPAVGDKNAVITMATPFTIVVEYWKARPASKLHITLHLKTDQGIVAFTTGSADAAGGSGTAGRHGLFRSSCQVPGDLLNSGVHSVLLLVVSDGTTVIYHRDDVISFDVVDDRQRGIAWYGREPGIVQPHLRWTNELVESARHEGLAR